MKNYEYEERFQPGDEVIEVKSGQKLTIEHDYGENFHPPYTVRENNMLYFGKDLQLIQKKGKNH